MLKAFVLEVVKGPIFHMKKVQRKMTLQQYSCFFFWLSSSFQFSVDDSALIPEMPGLRTKVGS